MNTVRLFTKFVAQSTLVLLVCATLLSVAFAGWLDGKGFMQIVFPVTAFFWRFTAIYCIPFVILIGAPLYLLASRKPLRRVLFTFLAGVTTLLVAYISFPVVQQCDTSFLARRTILSQLSAEEASTLTVRHTLSDDFNDDELHFPLSRYCPCYFDYQQQGEIKNVSIHDGEIFYGRGSTQ